MPQLCRHRFLLYSLREVVASGLGNSRRDQIEMEFGAEAGTTLEAPWRTGVRVQVATMGARPKSQSLSETCRVLLGAAARTAREQTFRAAVNFVAKSLRGPRRLAYWIAFIERHHNEHAAPLPDPRVLRKPLRNYGRIGRCVDERVDALIAHYVYAAAHLPPAVHSAIIRGARVRLATIEARGTSFDLWLGPSLGAGQKQEGELALLFTDAAGLALARMGFSFGRDIDGTTTLLIGGVQGLEPGTDKKVIVRATRVLSGLGPKDAALVGVQAMARAAGVERLLAVTNASHVLAAEWFMSGSVISRDYEACGTERGGKPACQYGYILPMPNYQARVAATGTPRLVDQYRAALSDQIASRLAKTQTPR